ncbi:TPA: restriction endonuclease subunit S [Escherichia coli]|uniref:restriction endonuclease subunit S n=1 Tax=Enterobacteriaceae TaxID=543 RepID=UPI0019244A7B|nr:MULTISPECIES: restriction endonuclease subunit S [Enterobacteriaceae]MCN8244154.1 restriction endonuclease subunit S [Escherichia coli]WJR70849.1 restriction endonuclease subunit S [Enterobacter hormaechei subsp. xiangfangensis]MCK6818645.1 restriction endonuclease subunit S [Enterobacter chengduensis]QQW43740.1 restriction endonuclease subunit S [Enterobacter hormaechei]UYM54647.1 restriction endonuclease subunit S [Leclercia adecarboxylata]
MSRWRNFCITELADFCNAQRIPLSAMERAHKKGNFPYYGASGIVDYIDNYIFDGSYILISEDGENLKSRKTPIAFEATGKFWVNNHAHVLKAKKPHLTALIIQYFSQLELSPYLTGAAQPKLNKASLNLIPLYLPIDESEQKAIASILSSLKDKIDLLHCQNKTLESMAETLFRQWFIEEAQDEWPEKSLNQYVELNKSSISKKYDFKEIQYLDTGSLTKGKISELQKILLSDAPSRAKRLVNNFDIIISTVRPDQCHYGICIDPPSNLVVSTGFCVITSKSLSPFFIYYLITSEDMTEYLHSIAEGSTSTYPSLKPEDIGNIPFLYPSEEKLKNFHDLVGSYWNKIHNNHKKIQTLETLRDTLLPKLMSGEVRVQYAEEKLESVA